MTPCPRQQELLERLRRERKREAEVVTSLPACHRSAEPPVPRSASRVAMHYDRSAQPHAKGKVMKKYTVLLVAAISIVAAVVVFLRKKRAAELLDSAKERTSSWGEAATTKGDEVASSIPRQPIVPPAPLPRRPRTPSSFRRLQRRASSWGDAATTKADEVASSVAEAADSATSAAAKKAKDTVELQASAKERASSAGVTRRRPRQMKSLARSPRQPIVPPAPLPRRPRTPSSSSRGRRRGSPRPARASANCSRGNFV